MRRRGLFGEMGREGVGGGEVVERTMNKGVSFVEFDFNSWDVFFGGMICL
jgi:hypothetical protein